MPDHYNLISITMNKDSELNTKFVESKFKYQINHIYILKLKFNMNYNSRKHSHSLKTEKENFEKMFKF